MSRVITLKRAVPDGVACFAFGASESGPGESNIDIAIQAITFARQNNIGIIAQGEVADAIRAQGYGHLIQAEVELGEKYLTSIDVWDILSKKANEMGWKNIVIVGNEIHMLRLVMFVVGISRVCAVILSSVYDQYSTQLWTRTRFSEIKHELSLIVHPQAIKIFLGNRKT